MARVSDPNKQQTQAPKRVTPPKGPVPPIRENASINPTKRVGMGDVQAARVNARLPNAMGRAQSNQIAVQQMQQRQYRAMPDRNTPAGYTAPYNQMRQRQAAFAAPYMSAYGQRQPATMNAVRQYDQTGMSQYQAAQPFRAPGGNNAYAAGYAPGAAQYNPWAPDYNAARQYMGYGSPSYGLKPVDNSFHTPPYSDYTYTPPKTPTGGYTDWGDWGGYGGGGGGGGGGFERMPEWFEKMINWKF